MRGLSPNPIAGTAKLADAQIAAIQGLSATGFSTVRFYGSGHTDATAYLRTSNTWNNTMRSMGLHRPTEPSNAAFGCETIVQPYGYGTCVGAWKALVNDRIDSGDEKWGDNTGWKAANDHNRYFVDYSRANHCFEGGEGRWPWNR